MKIKVTLHLCEVVCPLAETLFGVEFSGYHQFFGIFRLVCRAKTG